MNVNVLLLEPGLSLGSFDDVLFVYWHQVPTVATATALSDVLARFVTQHPEGVGLFGVIEDAVGIPDGPARTLLSSSMSHAEAHIKCVAIAYEQTGFKAAAMRGAVTGVVLASRTRYSTKVFASVAEAAAWLAPGVPHRHTAAEIVAAARELRARATEQGR